MVRAASFDSGRKDALKILCAIGNPLQGKRHARECLYKKLSFGDDAGQERILVRRLLVKVVPAVVTLSQPCTSVTSRPRILSEQISARRAVGGGPSKEQQRIFELNFLYADPRSLNVNVI